MKSSLDRIKKRVEEHLPVDSPLRRTLSREQEAHVRQMLREDRPLVLEEIFGRSTARWRDLLEDLSDTFSLRTVYAHLSDKTETSSLLYLFPVGKVPPDRRTFVVKADEGRYFELRLADQKAAGTFQDGAYHFDFDLSSMPVGTYKARLIERAHEGFVLRLQTDIIIDHKYTGLSRAEELLKSLLDELRLAEAFDAIGSMNRKNLRESLQQELFALAASMQNRVTFTR